MSIEKYKSDEFIARLIGKGLSAEEMAEFESWKSQNPDDAEFFDDINALWEDSQRLETVKGQSSEERWNRLASVMVDTPQKPVKVIPWRMISIAASMVLIATMAFLLTRPKIVEIAVPLGAEAMVIYLPDSSKVTLSADSKISYHAKNWDVSRAVTLRGEGFFEVKKSDAPFVVSSLMSSVRVLGTSFNIKERNERVSVFCETGRVEVSAPQQEKKAIILTPGLSISRTSNESFGEPHLVRDLWKITSWRNGEFHFSADPLPIVFEEIERQFNIDIEPQKDFSDIKFTGSFKRGNVNKALEIICLSSGLEFEVKNSKVRIFRK